MILAQTNSFSVFIYKRAIYSWIFSRCKDRADSRTNKSGICQLVRYASINFFSVTVRCYKRWLLNRTKIVVNNYFWIYLLYFSLRRNFIIIFEKWNTSSSSSSASFLPPSPPPISRFSLDSFEDYKFRTHRNTLTSPSTIVKIEH